MSSGYLHRFASLVLSAGLTFAACGDTTGSGAPDAAVAPGDRDAGGVDAAEEAPAPELKMSQLTVTANPSNTLSFYVEWRTPEDATSTLTVECGDDYSVTIERSTPSGRHEAFVMGLYEGAECVIRAESRTETGAIGVATTDWSVPPVREGLLPLTALWVHDSERVQRGWTLFNVSNQVRNTPFRAVVVDEQGRFRWYYEHFGIDPGGSTDMKVVPDGILMGGSLAVMMIVDWEGQVVWDAPTTMHHEIWPWGDGQLMYLVTTLYCLESWGDAIRIYDMARGEEIWDFNHCEHQLPLTIETDWQHLNGIAPFPDQNAVLTSSRIQHSLYKVNLDTAQLEWQLGFPPGPYDLDRGEDVPLLEWTGGERFYFQHAPQIQADGKTVVLFDNGSPTERPWSRAVAVEVDEAAMQAHQVQQWRPEIDIFAEIWGDADRLPNGNVLATFGVRAYITSHLIEMAGDRDEAWHLEVEVEEGVYRAERIEVPELAYFIE